MLHLLNARPAFASEAVLDHALTHGSLDVVRWFVVNAVDTFGIAKVALATKALGHGHADVYDCLAAAFNHPPPPAALVQSGAVAACKSGGASFIRYYEHCALKLPHAALNGPACACFSRTSPTQVTAPRLVASSAKMLEALGVSSLDGAAEYCSGNTLIPWSEPAAHCYCGWGTGTLARLRPRPGDRGGSSR